MRRRGPAVGACLPARTHVVCQKNTESLATPNPENNTGYDATHIDTRKPTVYVRSSTRREVRYTPADAWAGDARINEQSRRKDVTVTSVTFPFSALLILEWKRDSSSS